jgi:hypothetical protein
MRLPHEPWHVTWEKLLGEAQAERGAAARDAQTKARRLWWRLQKVQNRGEKLLNRIEHGGRSKGRGR